jgi:predicted porin
MKKLVLASAVAAVMASSAVMADTTVYGKLRMSLTMSETQAGVKDTGVANQSSRFGFKGSEDLGNGLSAIYHIELGYNADGDGGPVSNRIGMAGLKGDFGTVAIGNMWTPSYNLVRGPHDPFNSVGGNVMGGNFPAAFRVDDAIAYSNTFGAVTVAAAIISSDGAGPAGTPPAAGTNTEDDSITDHFDFAVSVPVGPVTIGVAAGQTNADVAANEKSPTALNIGWADGALAVDLGIFMFDIDGADDGLAVTGSYTMGSNVITAQLEDNGVDTQTNLGYVRKMSKKTSVFAEISTGDAYTESTNFGIHVNF